MEQAGREGVVLDRFPPSSSWPILGLRLVRNWAMKPVLTHLLHWSTEIAGVCAHQVVMQHIWAHHVVPHLVGQVLTVGNVLWQLNSVINKICS